MAKFYFTYGQSDRQPFKGGWTEVEAANAEDACRAFRLVHPDRTPGILNCAGIYTEEQFRNTAMHNDHRGNFDRFCVERITFTHEIIDDKETET